MSANKQLLMNFQDKTKIIKLLDFSFDSSFHPKVGEVDSVVAKAFPFSWTFDNSRQATYNYARERDLLPF